MATISDLMGKLIDLFDAGRPIPAEERQLLLIEALAQCRREATKITSESNDGHNCCKYCNSCGDAHYQDCPVTRAADIFWLAYYAVSVADRR